jgi:uncharacterized membrane protein YbhN (UPF0104 family)
MGARSKRVMRGILVSRWLRWLLPIAAVAAALLVLRSRLPSAGAVLDALDTASPVWLAVAVLAEVVSLDMFARQQRRLLRAFGVRMSQRRAVALTYSRSAITYAVPAGSAVSAGFAFSQFRSRGASRSAATTVTLLSGVASTVGLLAVYLADVLSTVAPPALAGWLPTGGTRSGTGLLAESAGLIALVAAGVLAGVAAHRHTTHRHTTHRHTTHRHARPITARPAAARPAVAAPSRWPLLSRAWASVTEAAREVRTVPRRHWYAAIGLAALNWLADMICLAAVAHALHLSLGMLTLGSAYLAVQLVRQVPVTPGGVGLVETSLLAALVSAGAGQAPAAAAVLGYRLLSCWLIIPVGMATWFALRRPSGKDAVADKDEAADKDRVADKDEPADKDEAPADLRQPELAGCPG